LDPNLVPQFFLKLLYSMPKNGFGSNYIPAKKKPVRRKRVPGYGGMIGRGLGWAQRNFTSKGSTANWVVGKVRQLADAVNIEYKEFEINSNPTPDYGGSVAVLCAPTQGVGFTSRVGDSIKMQTLTLRGKVIAGPTLAETVRIIVFNDKQNVITTGTDLLDNPGTPYVVLAGKNEATKYQSQILFDRTFNVSPGYRPIIDFEAVIPINLHTHFVAGSTTIKDNALKNCIISGLSSASATAQVLWCSYVSYTDD